MVHVEKWFQAYIEFSLMVKTLHHLGVGEKASG